jgi:hypothetical protein
VFPLVGPDGRIAAPLGGAPELAALAPVISLGSALVRRGLSADEAALAAAILDGARVLTYPSPVGRAAALPDIAGLLEWWPGADEIAAAERAAPLGELATLAALAEAGRTATQTDLATALARIATLEEALDEARDEMRRLQLQLNRRDEELGGLMVALEQERRALRSVTSRRPVKLALKLGDVSKRVPGR